MLSAKYYNLIADVISKIEAKPVEQRLVIGKYDIIRAMADEFRRDNPRFDADRFVAACYGEKIKS